EFGSGVHNALFGGPHLIPVSLLHMKHNWNQSPIPALRDQRAAYIAPTNQRWTGLGKAGSYEFHSDMLPDAATDMLDALGRPPSSERPEDDGSAQEAPSSGDEGEAPPITAWIKKPRIPGNDALSKAGRSTEATDMRRPALLAVATGGYQIRWHFCIESQR